MKPPTRCCSTSRNVQIQLFISTVGDVAVLPEHIPHCFKNRKASNAQMLAFVDPAWFDHFIKEVGRSAIVGRSPPSVDDVEKKRLMEAAPIYSLTLRPDIQF